MTEPAGDFAKSAKNGLQSKVLGAPLYIWGGGFVVVFYVYKKWSDKKKAATVDATTITPDLVHPGGLPSTQVGASTGSGSLPVPSSGSVSGINTSNFLAGTLSPQDWVAQGTAYLAALGYDGTKANQYLSSFTTGVQPAGEASRYVNLVLNRYGSPDGISTYQPGATLNSPVVVRFVKRSDNPAVFAQYSDGSLHWVTNPTELQNIATSAGLLGSDGGAAITYISANDPLWTSAGVRFSTTYPYTPITSDTPTGHYAGEGTDPNTGWTLPNVGTLPG